MSRYTPLQWSDFDPTFPLSAERMTHIENGIVASNGRRYALATAPTFTLSSVGFTPISNLSPFGDPSADEFTVTADGITCLISGLFLVTTYAAIAPGSATRVGVGVGLNAAAPVSAYQFLVGASGASTNINAPVLIPTTAGVTFRPYAYANAFTPTAPNISAGRIAVIRVSD